MKKIILQELEITNFKGIKYKKLTFNETITNIIGKNGSGKTTIFDSFVWLLFAKDSEDRTTDNANIRPLDENNNKIHYVDCIVKGIFKIDDKIVELKREYKEKWTKKRGEINEEFTGNEIVCYINELKVKSTEYRQYINEIIDERLFKLLTIPTYFNNLPWKEQREIIIENIDYISDDEIIQKNSELKELVIVNNIDDTKKLAIQKKNIIKKQSNEIPSKMEELQLLLAKKEEEKQAIGVVELQETQEKIKKLNEEINIIQNRIETIRTEISEKDKRVFETQEKIKRYINDKITHNILKNAENSKNMTQHETDLKVIDLKLEQYNTQLNNSVLERENLLKNHQSLTLTLEEIQQKQADTSYLNTTCQSCGQQLTAKQQEEEKERTIATFNTQKENRINNIKKEIHDTVEKGKNTAKEIDKLKDSIKTLEEEKERKTSTKTLDFEELPTDETVYINDEEYKTLLSELSILKTDETLANSIDELNLRKHGIIEKLNGYNEKIKEYDKMQYINSEIKNINDRLLELEEEHQKTIEEINKHDKTLYLCDLFMEYKISEINKQVKEKFNGLTFKLYEEQINGGVVETCELVENGVPYSALNNAKKINVGLKMIDVLCAINNVIAPIFIDNRESVSQIEEMKGQVINLIVPNKEVLQDIEL